MELNKPIVTLNIVFVNGFLLYIERVADMAALIILGVAATAVLFLVFGVIGFAAVKVAWEYAIELLF